MNRLAILSSILTSLLLLLTADSHGLLVFNDHEKGVYLKTSRNDGKIDNTANGEDAGTNTEGMREHSRKWPLRTGPGLTENQKNKVIALHNKLRREEGASDMLKLKYSNRLAQLAQDWSDRCQWGHRPDNSYTASDYGFNEIGENIWVWSGEGVGSIPEQPINEWFQEKKFFNYDKNYCSREPCAHYTAIVWSQTTEVGCGFSRCASMSNSHYTDAHYFVCNYGPRGNTVDEKPFKKGPACSECSTGKFYCTNGLCDRSCKEVGSGNTCQCKAKCENGNQTPDCKCRCNPGFTGFTCAEKCQNNDQRCGVELGWTADVCRDKKLFDGIMFETVNRLCPKLCGKCK